ncbi:MAG: OmpA family protein [Bacteroidales bacterium]
MKKKSLFYSLFLSAALIFSSCNMNNTAKGGLIGGGGGAGLGAGIGALIGGGKGAGIGAAIGGVVGTTAGILIGKKMDKQKKELEEQIKNAQIEEVTDANGLKAIKVTFNSGILFATGKSNLSQTAKSELSEFASSLINNPGTDVAILGYTDNTGSLAVNEKLSLERAQSVGNYLINSGVPAGRVTTKGMAWNDPVASNATPEGRAQNRRVEIYITADQQMIKNAESGNLN